MRINSSISMGWMDAKQAKNHHEVYVLYKVHIRHMNGSIELCCVRSFSIVRVGDVPSLVCERTLFALQHGIVDSKSSRVRILKWKFVLSASAMTNWETVCPCQKLTWKPMQRSMRCCCVRYDTCKHGYAHSKHTRTLTVRVWKRNFLQNFHVP